HSRLRRGVMKNAVLVAEYSGPPLARPAEPKTQEERPDEVTALALVELLLKDPSKVNRLNRLPSSQRELFPRFLLIGLSSYLVYSLVMVLMLNIAPTAAYPSSSFLAFPSALWSDGTAWSLPLAYSISIVLAACVCLPSFYFYSLLAGLRMTWLQIVSVVG